MLLINRLTVVVLISEIVLTCACKPRTQPRSSLAADATDFVDFSADVDRVGQLAGKTVNQVTEFQRVAQIAPGLTLALYGGTAREMVDFVRRKATELGGLDQYQAWLDTNPRVHLYDFHRAESDLDLMFLPSQADQPATALETEERARAVKQLQAELPGNLFYEKLDIYFPYDFFHENYPILSDHLQATSNVLLTADGIFESLSYLNITYKGQPLNLARDGAVQILSGKFKPRLAEKFDQSPVWRSDIYLHVRQYMRWVRDLSEFKYATIDDDGRKDMDRLYAFITAPEQQAQLKIELGNEKILSALEKLQLYSRNSGRTAQLLQEYKLKNLFPQNRVLKAVQYRAPQAVPKNTKTLGNYTGGKPLIAYHRTSLAASQSIADGALWMSDNNAIIGGKVTASVMTDAALYVAAKQNSASYGQFFVEVELDPDAIEGIDFVGNVDGYLALRTANAILHDASGKPKIKRLSFADLCHQLVTQIKSGELKSQEIEYNFRTIGALLYPTDSAEDRQRFLEAYQLARQFKTQQVLLDTTFQKLGVIEKILTSEDRELIAILNKWVNINDPQAAIVNAALNVDGVMDILAPNVRAKIIEELRSQLERNNDGVYTRSRLAERYAGPATMANFLRSFDKGGDLHSILPFNEKRQADQIFINELKARGLSTSILASMLQTEGGKFRQIALQSLYPFTSEQNILILHKLFSRGGFAEIIMDCTKNNPEFEQDLKLYLQNRRTPAIARRLNFDFTNPLDLKVFLEQARPILGTIFRDRIDKLGKSQEKNEIVFDSNSLDFVFKVGLSAFIRQPEALWNANRELCEILLETYVQTKYKAGQLGTANNFFYFASSNRELSALKISSLDDPLFSARLDQWGALQPQQLSGFDQALLDAIIKYGSAERMSALASINISFMNKVIDQITPDRRSAMIKECDPQTPLWESLFKERPDIRRNYLTSTQNPKLNFEIPADREFVAVGSIWLRNFFEANPERARLLFRDRPDVLSQFTPGFATGVCDEVIEVVRKKIAKAKRRKNQ